MIKINKNQIWVSKKDNNKFIILIKKQEGFNFQNDVWYILIFKNGKPYGSSFNLTERGIKNNYEFVRNVNNPSMNEIWIHKTLNKSIKILVRQTQNSCHVLDIENNKTKIVSISNIWMLYEEENRLKKQKMEEILNVRNRLSSII